MLIKIIPIESGCFSYFIATFVASNEEQPDFCALQDGGLLSTGKSMGLNTFLYRGPDGHVAQKEIEMEKEKENMTGGLYGSAIFPDCPVRNILARLSDKWSLIVMHELLQHIGPMRFSALRKAIPDISQKMLTQTLRHLEDDGFLLRQVYPEVPPRTEYTLTARARSFMDACRPMVQWAIDNFAAIMRDRASSLRTANPSQQTID